MKRNSFSVVAPFVLGLCLYACGSASAQGGHAHPDGGGGGDDPPVGVFEAGCSASINGVNVTNTGTTTLTASITVYPNADNEGSSGGSGPTVMSCQAYSSSPKSGSFDYTIKLVIQNQDSQSTVTGSASWTSPINVAGQANVSASCNSTVAFGSANLTGGAGNGTSYNTNGSATGSGAVPPTAPYYTVIGTASGSADCTGPGSC